MKKFKTVQEEVNWWKSLTLKERQDIIGKKIEKDKKSREKSLIRNFEEYLRSGKRTY